MQKKFRALTLAEVLITMTVVGIVAAITLPVVINKIRMKHFITLLKEDYSIMQQAFVDIAGENGTFKEGLEYCSTNNNVCLKNAFQKKIKNVRDCVSNKTTKNKCFVEQNKVKNFNGKPANSMYFNDNNTSGFLMPNGSSIAFWNDSPNCDKYNRCGWFTLDVNGIKTPNQWGKDIFYFEILPDKIRPCCKDSSIIDHDCKTNGYACAFEYLYKKND